MNGSGIGGGIGTVNDGGGDDAASAVDAASRAKRSAMEEEFALLMTACAHVSRLDPPSAPAPAAGGAARAAEIWRRVDGPVTAAPSAPRTTASFVTRIVHKELGPMDVTVERKDDSVRVIFEVSDAVAQIALETQRSALVASLHAAGVQVASVVVAVGARGTALAPKGSVKGSKRDAGEAPTGGGGGARRELDLVG